MNKEQLQINTTITYGFCSTSLFF